MKAECKSDANAWKIMSVYYKSFQQDSLFRDALIKRVRALQIDEWERDETQVAAFYVLMVYYFGLDL